MNITQTELEMIDTALRQCANFIHYIYHKHYSELHPGDFYYTLHGASLNLNFDETRRAIQLLSDKLGKDCGLPFEHDTYSKPAIIKSTSEEEPEY